MKTKNKRISNTMEKGVAIATNHKLSLDFAEELSKDLIYDKIRQNVYSIVFPEINEVQFYSFITHISSIIRNIKKINQQVIYVETDRYGNIVVPGARFDCAVRCNDKFYINEFSVSTALNKYAASSRARGLSLLLKLFDVPVFYIPNQELRGIYVSRNVATESVEHILDVLLIAQKIAKSSGIRSIRRDVISTLDFVDIVLRKLEENDELLLAFIVAEAIKESYCGRPLDSSQIGLDMSVAFMLFNHSEYVRVECKEETEIKKYLATIT